MFEKTKYVTLFFKLFQLEKRKNILKSRLNTLKGEKFSVRIELEVSRISKTIVHGLRVVDALKQLLNSPSERRINLDFLR